jgi:NADH-quinone oxidoreductase subunit H
MYELLTDLLGNQVLGYIIGASLPLIFILIFVLFAVYLERKVSAHMQDRLGPMRVGWHGIIQTLADMLKLLQKEDIVPDGADKKLFNLAPFLTFLGTYAAFAAIPFAADYVGSSTAIGIFYITAVSGLVVAGLLLAGWASDNKYSLYGAMRTAAQIVSYEIPTAIAILTMVMVSGTLSLMEISKMQTAHFWNWWILGGPETGIVKFLLIPFMIIGFLIYFISSLAEVNRTPFDLPEAESELVSGYHTEYSGMKFAFFFLAEYANMFAVAAIASTLFLGGYHSPIGYLGNSLGAHWLIPLEQLFWFTMKGLFLVFVQMWLRWTLPRVRVDQLMVICWKYLIPYAVANLIIVGIITLL